MAGSRRLTDLSEGVLARVREQIPEGRLVVALSGGADSAVCAWAVDRLETEPRTVHIDHGWPDSPALRKAALAVADRLDLDCRVVDSSSCNRAIPGRSGSIGSLRSARR